MHIPNEVVQAGFGWELFPGPADAKLLFVRRSPFAGFLARVFANKLAAPVENFESDLFLRRTLQRVIPISSASSNFLASLISS